MDVQAVKAECTRRVIARREKPQFRKIYGSGGEGRILFLADPKLVFDAPQPPDRWIALLHWREAEEFLAADQKIREMNRIRQRVDPTAYAQASAELKRAAGALEKRLGRSG